MDTSAEAFVRAWNSGRRDVCRQIIAALRASGYYGTERPPFIDRRDDTDRDNEEEAEAQGITVGDLIAGR